MTKSQTRRIAYFALACLLTAQQAFANNGSFVVAYPANNIQVDGDFTDWPAQAESHSIRHNVYGSPTRGSEDCNASFRAAYDKSRHLLFIAVEVKDDSLVEDSLIQAWNTRDGNGIRLGVNHGAKGVVGFDFAVKGKETSRGDRVFGAVQREDGVHRYEWKLDIRLLGQTGDLSQPFTCAFALDVTDDDADGTFHSQFWSPLPFKMIHPDRLGDIVLGVVPAECGQLKGSIVSEFFAKQMGHVLLRIQSKENANLLVDVLTDEEGNYSVSLPAGEYVRSLRVGGKNTLSTPLIIKAGEQTSDSIDVSPVSQKIVKRLVPTESQTIGTGFPSHRSFEVSKLVDSNLAFTTYNSSDGLPQVDISSIIEDGNGNLWIGFHGGLIRFDGHKLDTFTNLNGNESPDVYALLSDDQTGGFWIGSNRGLFHVDTKNDRLTTFRQLSGKMVTSLGHAPGGRICAGTTHGLYVYDGKTFRVFSEQCGITSPVQAIELDRSNKFTWIGTENGLQRFDGHNLLPVKQAQTSTHNSSQRLAYSWPDGLENDRVFSLYSEESGLWIGASDAIYFYDGEAFHKVFASESEQYWFARSFHRDRMGSLWIATHDGILRLPHNAKSIEQIRDQIRFSRLPIANCVYSDSTGTVWSGHFNGTLRKYDNNLEQLYAGNCNSVSIDSTGAIYFLESARDGDATVSWLCRYQNGAIHRSPLPGKGTVLKTIGDKILVGTLNDGVFQYDDSAFSPIDIFSDEGPVEVFDIQSGNDGEIWVATAIGLYRRDNDGNITRLTTRHGLPSDRVEFVDKFRDGRLVIGTLNGLAILSEDRLVEKLTARDGLLSNFVTALHVDRNDRLWIGTLDGLHAYADEKLTKMTTSDGLIRNHVDHFIADDQDGQMWIGSSVGISRFQYPGKIVQKLVEADGLDRGEVRDIAFSKEHIWLAGSQGLFRYTKSPIAPKVVLDKIVTGQVLAPSSVVKLTTDQQHFRMDFHAASLTTRNEAILFGYRLHPGDDWTIGPNRFVEYSALPRGRYSFEVFAIDRDLNRSEPLRVRVDVSLPYARYAILGTMFLALGTSFLLLGSRARKIRRINKELELRVEKRTAEREELQEQLQHSQKMESLGTLAAGIAHDFNNALCAIQVNVELAQNLRDSSKPNVYLAHVLKACDQAAGLSNSLLTFGGKGKLEVKPNELGQLIRSCLDMIRRTLPATIEFDLKIPQRKYWSSVDSHQIEQVLVNLCVNARDAMPNGGKLTVELFSRRQSTADSQNEADVAVNVIRISDTGTGIPTELHSRVFEPFFTSKPRGKGTGLGLSIAHGIVSEHGGQMVLRSEADTGCIFEIELPECGPQELPAEQNVMDFNNAMTVSKNQLVIVADDDDILRSALVMALETAGLEVISAKDGRDFIRKAKKNLDRLGMVVLDIDMPRSNGINCLREIRELRPNIEAIVITGLSTHHATFVRDEKTRFLKKPFSINRFIDAVESASKPVANLA